MKFIELAIINVHKNYTFIYYFNKQMINRIY